MELLPSECRCMQQFGQVTINRPCGCPVGHKQPALPPTRGVPCAQQQLVHSESHKWGAVQRARRRRVTEEGTVYSAYAQES
jgi:hypothetical protein